MRITVSSSPIPGRVEWCLHDGNRQLGPFLIFNGRHDPRLTYYERYDQAISSHIDVGLCTLADF